MSLIRMVMGKFLSSFEGGSSVLTHNGFVGSQPRSSFLVFSSSLLSSIESPGYIMIVYDGEEEYSGGDFGYGEVFRFGDGC